MATYQMNASIQWKLELPDEEVNVAQIARKCLESILPKNFEIQVLRVGYTNDKKKHLQCLGEFTLEEVFSKLSRDCERVGFIIEDQKYLVKMNSHRYFVFQNDPTCVACGLKGEKFLLEQHSSDKTPHFNLYGIDQGKMVLMTKDHITPKAAGGADSYENYITCCSICNNLKADYPMSYDQVAVLRRIWNDSALLSKKQRSKLIEDERSKMGIEKLETL